MMFTSSAGSKAIQRSKDTRPPKFHCRLQLVNEAASRLSIAPYRTQKQYLRPHIGSWETKENTLKAVYFEIGSWVLKADSAAKTMFDDCENDAGVDPGGNCELSETSPCAGVADESSIDMSVGGELQGSPSMVVETSLSSGASCTGSGDGQSSVSSLGKPKEFFIPDDFVLEAEKHSLSESWQSLRWTYLLVTLVVMLADGLQGTHLYVLYESYGFSVAGLYCLGFTTGGLLSPVTGPLIDDMGRKRAALLYCVLEVFINLLEQYPFYYGLVASRMIGGFTTNLLSTVFETWLDTEYRRRGIEKEKYELILRDSVIVSNVAAVVSGYMAHVLAEYYGVVGPFRGAVSCTLIAFLVILGVWSENYGTPSEDDSAKVSGVWKFLRDAISAYWHDSHMTRVGVTQGLTAASLQIFVFLWVPALRQFARYAPRGSLGLDKDGEPAYGLIFGAFMAAGVLGGCLAPQLRRWVTGLVSPAVDRVAPPSTILVDGEGVVPVRPMAVELVAATCYAVAAVCLMTPFFATDENPISFFYSLAAFLGYELIIGIFLPCEGVIRTIYFPSNARASVMTLPRVIVNVAVALAVASTTYITFKMAFALVGGLMILASLLQLSLVSKQEWTSLFHSLKKRYVSATRMHFSISGPRLAGSTVRTSKKDA